MPGPHRPLGAALALTACLLTGCGRKAPEGQIVATVNGDDITLRDLDRLQSRLPPNVTMSATLRRQMVQALIDARLAVQEARRERLAKTPDYLDASRAATDSILSQMLTSSVAQSLNPPTPTDVDHYLDAHAARFSGRQIVRLDQVRFAKTDAAMAAVRKVSTLDQAEAALNASGAPYQRSVVTVDTLALFDKEAASLDRLPPQGLLGDENQGIVSLSLVLARRPEQLDERHAREAAAALIQRDAARQAIAALRRRLRETARIQYQKGYAPSTSR